MDTLLLNGKIYIERDRFDSAVLLRDGLVYLTGTDAEVSAAAAEGAQVIDLDGKTVIPGFNDSHLHLMGLAESLQMIKLHNSKSISEVIERSKAYMREHNPPAGKTVYGRGWNQDYFTDENRLLNRHDLDKISTEHPLVFTRACGHVCVCNTKALEVAGITKDTPQIPGGNFETESGGSPNGVFSELALGMMNVLNVEPDMAENENILETAMKYASSKGITSLQTNDIKNEMYEHTWTLYQNLCDQNRAVVRTYHQCNFTDIEIYKESIAKGYVTGKGDDFNRIGPLKLFEDGSLGARTALMRADYNDAPGERGIACMTQEELDEYVKLAADNNMQVAVHAIGDRATEMVLDSFDKVISDGHNPLRHGVVHCQIMDEPLVNRFLKSDIFAYVQPIFLHYDIHIVEDRVGKALAETSYPFGRFGRMGVHVGYGTDSPVEDLDPFENIYCAVTRADMTGFPEGGFVPSERVDIFTAIDNYTTGSAYASFEENRKGRIKPGFFADLAVLDRDIFTVPNQEIKDVKVAMTILGGKTVYQKQV